MMSANRREWMAAGIGIAAAGSSGLDAIGATAASTTTTPEMTATTAPPALIYGMNTATLRGHKLGIAEAVAIIGKAGYGGIEPWVDELEAFEAAGKPAGELRSRIADAGLRVESAIGFFDWAVDDNARRRKGLDDARRAMGLVAKVGGIRIAAPASGATDARIDPARLADRYRALLELGVGMGVVPQVEVWGFSKTLGTLADAVAVAVGADHPSACVLPDVYHLHKGGSGVAGLGLLAEGAVHVLHMNDYPGEPPRAALDDSMRVYPGDGVAPLTAILRTMVAAGFRGMLSLELFNKSYYAQDPKLVARTGLAQMKAAVATAFG